MFKKIEKFTVGVKYTLEHSLIISKEGIKSEAQHQGFMKNLLSWYIYSIYVFAQILTKLFIYLEYIKIFDQVPSIVQTAVRFKRWNS